MKSIRYHLAIAILTLLPLFQSLLYAQKPDFYWGLDLEAVFDNREGDQTYADAKTFFLTQIAPEIGISLDNKKHIVAAGAVWTQPIGCELEGRRISPTIYYRYQDKGLRVALGMFGRDLLYADMPNYIWNDSVKYTQRNIRGAMIEYRNPKGYIQTILDWRGMQTKQQREAFNIIANGERQYKDGRFLWGGLGMMNHLAKDNSKDTTQYVVDNFVYNPYVGINLAKFPGVPLDSCSLRVGALGSLTRDREFGDWNTPVGVWVDLDVAWKFLELKNTFYAGGKLFPLYGKFNYLLDQGEPYYAASLYNRTSVSAVFLRRSFMELRATLDLNVVPSSINFYQRVILTINI